MRGLSLVGYGCLTVLCKVFVEAAQEASHTYDEAVTAFQALHPVSLGRCLERGEKERQAVRGGGCLKGGGEERGQCVYC